MSNYQDSMLRKISKLQGTIGEIEPFPKVCFRFLINNTLVLLSAKQGLRYVQAILQQEVTGWRQHRLLCVTQIEPKYWQSIFICATPARKRQQDLVYLGVVLLQSELISGMPNAGCEGAVHDTGIQGTPKSRCVMQ